MNIYVASSWKNSKQPEVVRFLQNLGHQVYNFRCPIFGDVGFHWSQIDLNPKNCTAQQFIDKLEHPIATKGYEFDKNALNKCDMCLLVLPCGKSAHLELGWACGAGKLTGILFTDDNTEPELMYKMVSMFFYSIEELEILEK